MSAIFTGPNIYFESILELSPEQQVKLNRWWKPENGDHYYCPRLGDTPETVLKIYQHVQANMDLSAAEKLGSMFKKQEGKPVVDSVVNEQKEKISDMTMYTENPLLN